MARNKLAQEYRRAGKPLICSFCGGKKFHFREAQLNTRVMSFFNLDWVNPKGDCYICRDCGHIMWFYSKTADL